ncbi:MAG: hypothetical protein C4527_13065 [Candidatus Omnitrophota bacterium]|jgi:C4-dicarboxylate-specific signal transduction histidine kinase|nr:MAG: hypothetical protein C4527_13065 [Candidatus Omnitrophota bacterium]
MLRLGMLSQTEDDLEIQRRRLIWLIGLRWYGAGSIILAVLIGHYVLAMRLPVMYLFSISAGMFLYNYYFYRQVYAASFHRRMALRQIILDVVILTLVLLGTGGFLNPFFTFYFFQVIIAWIILSYRESVLLTIFITLCFALQALAPAGVDMKTSSEGLLQLGELPFHVLGAPVSFVITTVITAYFVYIIMADLRKREQELRQARKQAELELNKLDNILGQLGAGMLVINRHQRMDWLNDQIREWFGPQGADETVACYRIVRVAKDLLSSMGKQVQNEYKRQFYHAMRLPTVSHGVRDFEIMVSPVCDGRGDLFQIIELVLDVTEQKKQQEQWSQAQRLAAIGQLAAGVAHEINTPLGTISILANEACEILTDHEDLNSCPHMDELRESLRTIHEQTRRCKTIIQSLLNISRKPEYEKKACSVNEIIHNALELAKHKLAGIAVEARLDPILPNLVTDVNGIERAVFNVILNAADAFPLRDYDKRIIIETGLFDEMVTIRIIDNGDGISEENLSRVFEPFFTTKSVGQGTGLGLYVSYETIRDLGGRLEIDSKPGAGAAVTISIPLHHDEF